MPDAVRLPAASPMRKPAKVSASCRASLLRFLVEANQASVPAKGIGFARAANGRTVQASLRLAV